MADDRKWVVLVQKVPRGPMGEEEIRELIGQRILTHNDLAFLISLDNPKAPTEWKFLWQFNEFDRRKPRLDGQPDPMAVKYAAQRKPVTEEEVKRRAKEALPVELVEISPSDLLPHLTSEVHLPTEAQLEAAREEHEERPLLKPSRRMPWAWVFAFGFAAGAFFLLRSMHLTTLFNFKSSGQEEANRSHPEENTQPEHPQMSFGTPEPVRGQASLPSARPPEPMRRPTPPPADPDPEPQSTPEDTAADNPPSDEAPPPEDANANNNEAPAAAQPADGNQQNATTPPADENRQPAEQPQEEDPETKRARDNFLGGM